MMLTPEERAQLAPVLARVRTIRAELVVADQEKAAADVLSLDPPMNVGAAACRR
jgi:hypothetical protein